MTGIRDLPNGVVHLIESCVVAEFATVSAAGLPIDTPTYVFPRDDLSTIDLATGLVNPAKAERARRNPLVGMLFEGAPHEPVIALRGHAAVRDSDFEANALRYIEETGFKQLDKDLTWGEARQRIQYWTRIIVEVTPLRILWWDDAAQLDRTPHVWNAPHADILPESDAAPAGRDTPGMWPARPWQEMAQDALDKGRVPHLTVCDEAGFPMPMRVSRFERTEYGFDLEMPGGLPWSPTGIATLGFEGHMILAGEAARHGGVIRFVAERALPRNPATQDSRKVLRLGEDIQATRQKRLEAELARRGKPIPRIPDEEPRPTRMALLRQARIDSDSPITGMRQT